MEDIAFMEIEKKVKKVFMKAFVSVMVLAAAVSFTSCGKGKDKKPDKEENPEYVYEADFKELGNIKMNSLSSACFSDGVIYIVASDIDYDKNYEIKSLKNYLLNCAVDSDKIDNTQITGLKDNEYVNNLFLDDENKLCMLTSILNYNKKTGESRSGNYMLKLDKSGKASDRIEIKPDKKDEENFYLSNNTVFREGKLFVYFDKSIYTFNKDGSAGKTYEADNYIEKMFAANDGKVYIISSMDNDLHGMGISEFDTETGKFGKPVALGNDSIYNIYDVNVAANGNVYISTDESLYEFNFEKGKAESVFNWINVDMDGISVSDFVPMEDGSFLVLNIMVDYAQAENGDASSDIEIATVSKKKYSDTKQKKRLTLASNYLDMYVKREILKFNKTNDSYRIDVADYSSYEDPIEQMNLDIAAGKIPDIIDVGYMPKELYIKKGFLTDLYSFIDKDDEINKEDFIETVRTTLENDGKLYYMPTSFMINALAGPKKVFGDMEGWSYEDMEKIYNDLPEGSSFMYNMTSEWFVDNILSTQMDNFVNYDTGEVNLDSEEFINMIEFSKNFKTNDNDDSDSSDDMTYAMSDGMGGGVTVSSNDESYELTRKGKVLLKTMDMYDLSDIQINEKLFKSQGGYNVISYPSSDKNNKLAISSAGNCFAISEKCDDKEGAWSFLRRLYTYEFQKEGLNFSGFPVRQDVMDKKIEYAMATKSYTDDDGTKVTPVTNYSYNYGGFKITLKPYTKEQMDVLRSIIGRIGVEMDYGSNYNEIPKIIQEEIKAFYSGDKTAKEVAEVIQSRVSIYVNENS